MKTFSGCSWRKNKCRGRISNFCKGKNFFLKNNLPSTSDTIVTKWSFVYFLYLVSGTIAYITHIANYYLMLIWIYIQISFKPANLKNVKLRSMLQCRDVFKTLWNICEGVFSKNCLRPFQRSSAGTYFELCKISMRELFCKSG